MDAEWRHYQGRAAAGKCRERGRQWRQSPKLQQQQQQEGEKESCGPILIKAVRFLFFSDSQEKLLRAPNLQQTDSIILQV